MTKIELGKFRDALKKRLAELENANNGREALAIETSADELDRIQHAQERDLAVGGLDRNAKMLREVRAALNRVADGSFGVCLDCEKDISVKRLAALPWTGSCIACQEAAEMAGGPWHAPEELQASAD
jgi:DnaK suppressor protein